MDVADRIAVMNAGAIEQVGAPRDLYDRPANEFVMGFLGPVARLGGNLVRPHDLVLGAEPEPGSREAMVSRVVHLGFEVRVELSLADGETLTAQLSREETAALDLRQGDIVYVRAPRKGDGVGTNWTEISNPVFMDAGADLMLLHPDGSEEVLVTGGKGSVTEQLLTTRPVPAPLRRQVALLGLGLVGLSLSDSIS